MKRLDMLRYSFVPGFDLKFDIGSGETNNATRPAPPSPRSGLKDFTGAFLFTIKTLS